MDSEQHIQQLFKNMYGIDLHKIPESDAKTPDFEFIDIGKRIFIAELKDINWEPPSEKTGWSRKDENSFWSRPDNSVQRIAEKIHSAYKQLKTYELPKVLIFFNNDHVDIKDLEEAYNGCHIYGNKDFSYKNTASAKFANGRICEEKSKIDLYFWIDHHDNDKIFLRVTSKDGERIAHKYFSELIKESEQDD